MTVIDRGLSVQEVDALSTTLETDLENVFRAIRAQAVEIIAKADDPSAAIAEIESMFNATINMGERIDEQSASVI